MKQEDKELFLKDLSARLPYGVNGRVYAETTKGEYDINGDMIFFDSPFDVTLDDINTSTEEIHVIAIGNEDMVDFIEDQQTWGDRYIVDEFKPYLRPMSRMSEEEEKEYHNLCYEEESEYYEFGVWTTRIYFHDTIESIDWLNAHHVDYRGLIEKGLALEAPEGMYK